MDIKMVAEERAEAVLSLDEFVHIVASHVRETRRTANACLTYLVPHVWRHTYTPRGPRRQSILPIPAFPGSVSCAPLVAEMRTYCLAYEWHVVERHSGSFHRFLEHDAGMVTFVYGESCPPLHISGTERRVYPAADVQHGAVEEEDRLIGRYLAPLLQSQEWLAREWAVCAARAMQSCAHAAASDGSAIGEWLQCFSAGRELPSSWQWSRVSVELMELAGRGRHGAVLSVVSKRTADRLRQGVIKHCLPGGLEAMLSEIADIQARAAHTGPDVYAEARTW